MTFRMEDTQNWVGTQDSQILRTNLQHLLDITWKYWLNYFERNAKRPITVSVFKTYFSVKR